MFLSKTAKTVKESQDGESDFVRIGGSCMQAWRWSMEDAFVAIPDMEGKGTSFVGVYDGHLTARAARFCAQTIHAQVLSRLNGDKSGHQEQEALHDSFLTVDQEFLESIKRHERLKEDEDPEYKTDLEEALIRAGGSTATVVLVSRYGTRVTVGHVGDSRCVMSKDNVAVELTRDHKPELADEKDRIEAAGGKVLFGRLGNLGISRGIGDFVYKRPGDFSPEKQQLTACPETKQLDLSGAEERCEFLVVASDGVWESKTNQEVVDFVRSKLEGGHSETKLSVICEELLDACMKKNPKDKSDPGSTDNMTVVIIQFRRD